MPQAPPRDPDIRRRLRERLLDLTPRAFEFFAGDLLTYLGLQGVEVTRYIGDGGVDAHGYLGTELVRVRTGVQVKRHRQNVRRPDIDRFIGALTGSFSHGVFITTAGYAPDARSKAATSPLRVDTIDGEQVTGLMARHGLGVLPAPGERQIDSDYFTALEARAAAGSSGAREGREAYVAGQDGAGGVAVRPEDDLISMHALGYALHVDPYTVQDWVRRGRLEPHQVLRVGRRESYFFRRDQVEAIRRRLVGAPPPASGAEWRQAFLDYVRGRNLTKSYKPALLLALLRLVDRNGEARLEDLAREFHRFYLERQAAGLPTEDDGPMVDPASAAPADVAELIVKHPLHRFIIKGFLEHDKQTGIVRFAPQLWAELRGYELLDARAGAEEQLRYYYARLAARR